MNYDRVWVPSVSRDYAYYYVDGTLRGMVVKDKGQWMASPVGPSAPTYHETKEQAQIALLMRL